MRRPPSVLVIYGPKGAGKSWVADELRRRAGVAHVDTDRVVLDLLDRGERPDPRLGWLEQVESEVRGALGDHAGVGRGHRRVGQRLDSGRPSDRGRVPGVAGLGDGAARGHPRPACPPAGQTCPPAGQKGAGDGGGGAVDPRQSDAAGRGRSFAAIIETSGRPDASRLDRLLESLRQHALFRRWSRVARAGQPHYGCDSARSRPPGARGNLSRINRSRRVTHQPESDTRWARLCRTSLDA